MKWENIINCVSHEMWTKLASTIKSIIDDKENNINIYDEPNIKSINKILNILTTKRNLDKEPADYLKNLID